MLNSRYGHVHYFHCITAVTNDRNGGGVGDFGDFYSGDSTVVLRKISTRIALLSLLFLSLNR